MFFGVHPGRGFVFVADRDLLVHDQWVRPLDPYGHRFIVAIRENVGPKMLFVCYPKCSTCGKVRKWLEENSISYEERDIKTENPTEEELKTWHRQSGLPLKRFFNTSGMIYRQMNLKDKLPTMSEEEQYQLLATDGMLVKRPILVDGQKVLVGFRQKEWEENVK